MQFKSVLTRTEQHRVAAVEESVHDYGKWIASSKLAEETCQAVSDSLWHWVSHTMASMWRKKMRKNTELNIASIALDLKVDPVEVEKWISFEDQEDDPPPETMKNDVKRILSTFGPPPEWKCAKCDKPLSEMPDLDALKTHVSTCRGIWKNHGQGKDGEWCSDGIRVVKVLMFHRDLATHGDLIEAAKLTEIENFTPNKLRQWMTGKAQVKEICDAISKDLWTWVNENALTLLKEAAATRSLSGKSLRDELILIGKRLEVRALEEKAVREAEEEARKKEEGDEVDEENKETQAPMDVESTPSPPLTLAEVEAWLSKEPMLELAPPPEDPESDDEPEHIPNENGKAFQRHIYKVVEFLGEPAFWRCKHCQLMAEDLQTPTSIGLSEMKNHCAKCSSGVESRPTLVVDVTSPGKAEKEGSMSQKQKDLSLFDAQSPRSRFDQAVGGRTQQCPVKSCGIFVQPGKGFLTHLGMKAKDGCLLHAAYQEQAKRQPKSGNSNSHKRKVPDEDGTAGKKSKSETDEADDGFDPRSVPDITYSRKSKVGGEGHRSVSPKVQDS